MGARKRGLSLDDHRRLGRKLAALSDGFTYIWGIIGRAYPKGQARAYDGISLHLTRLRAWLEGACHREHGEGCGGMSIYWPPSSHRSPVPGAGAELYRLKPDDGTGRPLSSAELASSRSSLVTTRSPDRLRPFGEWCCYVEGCAVRQVIVRAEFGDDPGSLPEVKCPMCGRPMSITRWLREETLLLVD